VIQQQRLNVLHSSVCKLILYDLFPMTYAANVHYQTQNHDSYVFLNANAASFDLALFLL